MSKTASYVDCRIGSLEMKYLPDLLKVPVDCRIGSLETYTVI